MHAVPNFVMYLSDQSRHAPPLEGINGGRYCAKELVTYSTNERRADGPPTHGPWHPTGGCSRLEGFAPSSYSQTAIKAFASSWRSCSLLFVPLGLRHASGLSARRRVEAGFDAGERADDVSCDEMCPCGRVPWAPDAGVASRKVFARRVRCFVGRRR